MQPASDVKVFGMKAETGRWFYVILGLIINICLGTVYSWSVFRKPVENLFNASATESSLPFMLFLAFFAITMPIGGRLLQKSTPRAIGILGGAIAGLGWLLSGFASNMVVLYITYGVIAGAGVGLAYGGPIAVAAQWFPDKKGLAVGLTVCGFGISALVTAPLARWMIDQVGPLDTFLYLGIAFLILTVVLALPLKFPAANWKPAGWKPSAATLRAVDFTTSQMMKKSAFYGLWFCFIIGTIAGLMAIGIASPVGQEIIKLDSATAAVLVSVFAIFNGGGRPLFGWLTDKLRPQTATILTFVLSGLASVGMLFAGPGSVALYVVCFSAFWLTLGGWLAIAPTATSTFFGPKFYSGNYGIVFTGYGIGAIIGNLISGQVRDIFGTYTYAFYPTAALAVIGIIIAILFVKSPKA